MGIFRQLRPALQFGAEVQREQHHTEKEGWLNRSERCRHRCYVCHRVARDGGFVCIVERSWTAPIDDPNFWNPKLRAPICFNAAAAHSYLPRTIKKTDLILAGRTKAQMIEAIVAAIDKKELSAMEPGAMCYMLSKQGYLSDRDGH